MRKRKGNEKEKREEKRKEKKREKRKEKREKRKDRRESPDNLIRFSVVCWFHMIIKCKPLLKADT